MPIPQSELIINPDGSIYHLNLRPEDVATTIITVGDPARVPMVSKYFDRIEVQKNKREFLTHTGWVGKKRVSVISTGIGPDNIDIIINEIDALFNIDFESKKAKEALTQLDFIRIGTSGSLQKGLDVDQFLASSYGIGFDNLLPFYYYQPNLGEAKLTDGFAEFLSFHHPINFYVSQSDRDLLSILGADMHKGITITAPGFYAPQGRRLRLAPQFDVSFFQALSQFEFKRELKITNLEMETSAIYGLSRLLGHRALSTNAILANRQAGTFSKTAKATVDLLIRNVLEKIENI